MNNNKVLFTCLFLIPLLSITFGDPAADESSLTTEVNNHPLLERELDNIEQLFPNITRNDDPILTEINTTQPASETDLVDVTTSEPSIPADENKLPQILVEENSNEKKIVSVKHREPAPLSSSVFVAAIAPNPQNRLFYVSDPVYRPQYRPAQHYRPASREMAFYNLLRGRENNSPFSPFQSAPIQPKHLGFPPISNTRENLGKQINWNAKIGRAHRSFYDYLTAY